MHTNKPAELTDISIMPYGKHKGLQMQDVPADYFNWLWHNGHKLNKTDAVAHYIRRNIHVFELENPDLIWD